jgi:starch synthase
MKILVVASEAYPLVKTGGLADVAGALPAALAALGQDVRLMLPGYPPVLDGAEGLGRWRSLGDPLGAGELRIALGRVPGGGLPLWVVDCPPRYRRDGGPYLDPEGRDWPDNHLRFALLARAAAMVCDAGALLGWRPDVLHAHDWQTGLAPAFLALRGGRRPRTVFTIHNIQFPGIFGGETLAQVGLPPESFTPDGVEYHGGLSFLKAGIRYGDRVNTVSPGYAREVLTPEGGAGFDGLLTARGDRFGGILNGIDAAVWNPAGDPLIAHPYSARHLASKRQNKAALQRETGLAPLPDAPLLGAISRLTVQKGLDLVLGALPQMLARGGQLVLLGAGESTLEVAFRLAAEAHPGRVSVRIGYDEALAHRIQAGCDLLLVPSRFEPCGLTQLYALRYGTLPVVRRTGGLADSVLDARETGAGTGFVFDAATVADLTAALTRAFALYARRADWQAMQRRAMGRDSSWEGAARQYLALYRDGE